MEKLTHDKLVEFIKSANIQFSNLIMNFKQDDYYHVLIVVLPQFIKKLVDSNNDQELKPTFELINELISKADEYLLDVLYETTIESLALSGKIYYDSAKIYLSEEAKCLLDEKKHNPPLGHLPVKY